MDLRDSFRFLNNDLNKELIGLLKKSKVKHSVDAHDIIHYSANEDDVVENDFICAVRDRVFSSWQVLTCPRDWIAVYKDYMSRHSIPFSEEISNGELWFLIPGDCQPHLWDLVDPANKKKKPPMRQKQNSR
ncbi:MAG: hypothetical protein L0Y72_05400 [Gemmataceae bacterium]|nr:hypothetical protein [Gemmataceae bacterium]